MAVRDRQASFLRQLENFTNGPGRKILLGDLALAVQHQPERFVEIRIGFLESLSLRNRGVNLLHKTGVSAFFPRFKYCGKLHGLRLSRHVTQHTFSYYGTIYGTIGPLCIVPQVRLQGWANLG